MSSTGWKVRPTGAAVLKKCLLNVFPSPVYVDGGITRGTGEQRRLFIRNLFHTLHADVLKALCLGARAVGLGRPFLYAQSVSAAICKISNQ